MVALNQQFTVLATFCSLAAISLFPLSANAVAIQQRTLVNNGKPGHHGSPTTSFYAANHKSQRVKQYKERALPWSPISNAIRLSDFAIGSAKRYYHDNTAGATIDRRHGDEAQAHFHQMRNTEAHVSRRDHIKRQPSIVIPNNRGGSYILSRSLRAGQGKPTKRNSEGESGRVDIMSPTSESPTGAKLASLCEQKSTNGTHIMNACEKNYTPVNLVYAPSSIQSSQSSEVPVSLQVVCPDPSQLDCCLTFKEKEASTEPQPLTVEECSDKQSSQKFGYNKKTGAIRPIPQEIDKNGDAAGVTSVIGRRDEGGEPVSAQNVTLVFVPDAPKVANAEEDIVTTTSTMTTTVTVTSMSTATSSASVANVDPTSTIETSVASSSVPSSSAVPSSTSKSPMVTSTPAAAFNVQVIGFNSTSSSDPTVASTTLKSNSTVPTTSMAAQEVRSSSVNASTTITSTSATPTSINAAEVAASIATSYASSAAYTKVISSTAVPTPAAVESSLTSEAASSSAPSMTPVSIAPYQMVFKADNRL